MSKRTSHRERINQTLQRTSESSVTQDFTKSDGDLQNIEIDLIATRTRQPRRQFDDQALQSLAQSIKSQGVMQPIVVHQQANGRFELVAGERRLRAAQQVGLFTIPAKVVSGLDESRLDFIAAMENLQREDLNPVDEVDAILSILSSELSVSRGELPAFLSYLRRVDRARHNVMSNEGTQESPDEDAVRKVEGVFSRLAKGNWQSFVANKMGVLRLPNDLLEAVRGGKLEYTKATTLRKVKDTEIRRRLLNGAGEMSLEQLRHLVRESTQQQSIKSDSFPIRLKKVANTEKWKTLDAKEQLQVSKLIEKLELLLKVNK